LYKQPENLDVNYAQVMGSKQEDKMTEIMSVTDQGVQCNQPEHCVHEFEEEIKLENNKHSSENSEISVSAIEEGVQTDNKPIQFKSMKAIEGATQTPVKMLANNMFNFETRSHRNTQASSNKNIGTSPPEKSKLKPSQFKLNPHVEESQISGISELEKATFTEFDDHNTEGASCQPRKKSLDSHSNYSKEPCQTKTHQNKSRFGKNPDPATSKVPEEKETCSNYNQVTFVVPDKNGEITPYCREMDDPDCLTKNRPQECLCRVPGKTCQIKLHRNMQRESTKPVFATSTISSQSKKRSLPRRNMEGNVDSNNSSESVGLQDHELDMPDSLTKGKQNEPSKLSWKTCKI
jgi:hypothetical protein